MNRRRRKRHDRPHAETHPWRPAHPPTTHSVSSSLLYADGPDQPPFVTDLMRRTATRCVATIRSSGIAVLSGRSRLGKSQTAEWITDTCEDGYDPENSETFRSVHYQVGAIASELPTAQKRAIAALLHKLQRAPVPEAQYRRFEPEALAESAARVLMRDRTRMVFVDEAGNYSIQAIRGLVLVRDVAESLGWAVAIVLVGMDDLPTKLEKVEQIRNRVHVWCHFTEYGEAELTEILAAVHPHFRPGAASAEEIAALVRYLHTLFGGVIGNIRPFLNQVDARLDTLGGRITLAALKAVRRLLVGDQRSIREDERRGYRRDTPTRDPTENDSQSDAAPTKKPPKRGRKRPPQRRKNRSSAADPTATSEGPDAEQHPEPGQRPEDLPGGGPE